MLRKLGEIGARSEGSFTDELASQDSDITAEGRVACVEDFHFRTAADQKKFFVGDEKRDSEIVAGRFAIAHFTENFLRDREQYIVATRFAANRCDLSDPFRARLSQRWVLVRRARRRLCAGVWWDAFHGGDETVAAAREGFDVTRLVGADGDDPRRRSKCEHACTRSPSESSGEPQRVAGAEVRPGTQGGSGLCRRAWRNVVPERKREPKRRGNGTAADLVVGRVGDAPS